MATTDFTAGTTVIAASWLNDVDEFVYSTGAPKASPTFTGTVTAPTVTASGAVTSSSASAGVGYATGAGGTVTQGTSKSTGVTLSKVCGDITMHNAALAAAAEVTFTVTSTIVAAGDMVVVAHASGGTAGAYLPVVSAIAAGSYSITVSNCSAGSLSEAIVLRIMVFKGVTA